MDWLGFLVLGQGREGGTQSAGVVGGRKQNLQATAAGGDGDGVVELSELVDEDGVRFLCSEGRHAAADVTREGLDFLERDCAGIAVARGLGERLQVECGSAGNDGEHDAGAIAAGNEGLESLVEGKVDLSGDGFSGEVLRVDFVFAEFKRDAERFEEADGIGFCWSHHPS